MFSKQLKKQVRRQGLELWILKLCFNIKLNGATQQNGKDITFAWIMTDFARLKEILKKTATFPLLPEGHVEFSS